MCYRLLFEAVHALPFPSRPHKPSSADFRRIAMRQIGTTPGGRSWLAGSVRLDPNAWCRFAEHRPQCFTQRDRVPHPLIGAIELQEEFNRTIGWIDLGPPPQKLGTRCIDLLGRNRICRFITGCAAHRDRGRIMLSVRERKPENLLTAQVRQSTARVLDFPSGLLCIQFQQRRMSYTM